MIINAVQKCQERYGDEQVCLRLSALGYWKIKFEC